MPLAVKVASGVFLLLVIIVYWRHYGPSNFLWLSDLGLACTVLAIILESRLLASMPAIGILALELAWTVDFLAGGRLLGLAGYMFDAGLPFYLRALSLFHLGIPPVLILLLQQHGYDARALPLQTLLTWASFVAVYRLTPPEKNINWVFGPGEAPQQAIPARLYFGIICVAVPLLVFVPTHFLLRWLFPAGLGG